MNRSHGKKAKAWQATEADSAPKGIPLICNTRKIPGKANTQKISGEVNTQKGYPWTQNSRRSP